MLTIKTFVFNPFQENTFLLYDETGESVIIDPGCMEDYENEEIIEFIEKSGLRPVKLFNTHAHIDHIPGNKFISEKFKIGLEIHKNSLSLLNSAKEYAAAFGFDNIEVIQPSGFIQDGDHIKFGNSELKVL